MLFLVATILYLLKIVVLRTIIAEDQRKSLEEAHLNQPIKVWGAVPREGNIRNYRKMNIGDAVLIYKDKYFTHAGYVSYKLINPKLAELFWGRDDSDKTWKLIYFLKYFT
jgi:hypothetical protein